MMKMYPEYAQKLLDGGRAFDHEFFSKTNGLLIIKDEIFGNTYYMGTGLKNGELQTNPEGYVVFLPVKPVIDENTKWTF